MGRLVGGTVLKRRLFAAVAVAVLATAACGSSKADDAGSPPPTEAAASDGSTTTTAQASKPGSSKSKASTTTTTTKPATGSASGLPTDPKNWKIEDDDPTNTLAITAELKTACVRPGGSQTITIRARPESGVGFDTVYSDGKSGMMDGHYGGNFGGYTDADGTFVNTWTVAPNAPAGEVVVRVLGTHEVDGMGQTEVYFKVADALGKCS